MIRDSGITFIRCAELGNGVEMWEMSLRSYFGKSFGAFISTEGSLFGIVQDLPQSGGLSARLLKLSGDTRQWNITFIILAQNWEVELNVSFFNLLYSLRLGGGCEDKIRWVPSKRESLRSELLLYIVYNTSSFSLKRHLAEKDSIEGGFLCVDS